MRQIVQRVPRWLIEKTANAYGVEARKFSATSHFVMLILGHLSRASCLTEICDDADLNKRKLSLVRNATPGRRNTFSHANRTRSSEVAEEVYWETARHLGEVTPGFIPPKRVRGFLSRFRDRGIFAIDSTVIKLALSCIASYPYRSKKAAANTAVKYPQTFRRVRAIVEVNGEKREMTFLTNNTKWAASTACELYRARWEIEVFFKELKQTLQLADFIGTNENAVKWQIWTGLLTHLLLHYLKFLSGWNKTFSRLVGIVRSAVWMDLDIVETLRLYGMASPPHRPRPHYIQQCLAGF